MIDFLGQKLNTFKASLHTHSTTSDGKFTPDEIIKLYHDHGYDILVFTDHKKTNKVSQLDGLGMTLISGMELHPMGPREIPWHFVAINVPENFVHPDVTTGQEAIDAAVAAGAYCIFAHPYWSGFTAEDIATLKNISAIEVYNTSTRFIGRDYDMKTWDELSDKGIVYPAVAVDDTHGAMHLFQAWTVIAAKSKSHDDFMDALRKGNFYATQGPEFTRIDYKDDVFEAEFSPCVSVVGMTNPSIGYCATVPDMLGPDTGAPEVTKCSFKLIRRTKPTWFRLQIIDAKGKYAWTNPVIVPPANN